MLQGRRPMLFRRGPVGVRDRCGATGGVELSPHWHLRRRGRDQIASVGGRILARRDWSQAHVNAIVSENSSSQWLAPRSGPRPGPRARQPSHIRDRSG